MNRVVPEGTNLSDTLQLALRICPASVRAKPAASITPAMALEPRDRAPVSHRRATIVFAVGQQRAHQTTQSLPPQRQLAFLPCRSLSLCLLQQTSRWQGQVTRLRLGRHSCATAQELALVGSSVDGNLAQAGAEKGSLPSHPASKQMGC
jgi:hypothetical protein